jgi:hypothetical protein
VLKLSKTITYNSGSGFNQLPSQLVAAKMKSLKSQKSEKSLADNERTAIEQLERGEAGDYVVAGLYDNEEIVAATPGPLPDQSPLAGHKRALKLKKILFIKKLSDIVSAIANKEKKIGAPCCPTGPCCPGNQG